MSKWSKTYWEDLGERVGSTAVYGVITALTTNGLANINTDVLWAIIGLPTVLSLLKGLLVNLPADTDTASLVGTTSNTTVDVPKLNHGVSYGPDQKNPEVSGVVQAPVTNTAAAPIANDPNSLDEQ